jgi:ATP-dependent Clp protease adaptor protein ClpS
MPDNNIDLLEKQENKLQRPKMYQVVMHNDDFTPFDLVIAILMKVFNKNADAAMSLMMQVHKQGKGICGVYTHEVAETKISEAMGFAKSQGAPLRLHAEPQP